MALVRLTTPGVIPDDTSGTSFYMRDGRAVVRTVVTPVDPRTPDQMRERAGVTAAARQWGGLSGADQLSFADSNCTQDWPGYWVWVYLSSALGWILEWIDGGPSDGSLVGSPEVSCLGVSEIGGGPVVQVSFPAAPTGSVASVAVSRPMSPGRRARRTDMRTGPAVPLDVPVDLSDWYVGRFGMGVIDGQQVRYQVVVASPDTRQSSCPVAVECPAGGGGQTCDIEPIPDTMEEFVSWLGLWTILTDPEDPSREFDLHLEGVGLTLNSGGPIFGGGVDIQYQVDNSNSPGDPVPWTMYIFDVATMETLCEVSGVVTVESI